MKLLFTILFVYTILLATVAPHTADEWKTRSVYQIITDRFERSRGETTPCDIFKYCGGTFKGIQNRLDYIQGMGFNAIWISPVVENTADGYHGYWVKNLYTINPEFGTEEELHELIQACHDRDIWVMVDIVANHIGYVNNTNNTNHDFSEIVPFNDPNFYNEYYSCDHIDFKVQADVERCWLCGLPDLNQDHPKVKQLLLDWVHEFVAKWKFDALRIDTVAHVSKAFWAEFSKKAGIFTIGEVLNFDIEYLASYQGPIDGILNYALYSSIRNGFQNGGSLTGIEEYYERAHRTWADQSLLGSFVNNHDNNRFLADSTNYQGFKAALAFSLGATGIPMVYYGDEQAFYGGKDPANREPMFDSFNRESDIYKFIRTINTIRNQTQYFNFDQVQRYADYNFYAFSRGQVLFAFTNSLEPQTRSITYHSYPEGTVLCNIFQRNDCVTVENGQFPVVLIGGETKIFAPIALVNPRKERARGRKEKVGLGIASTLFESSSI